MPNLTPIPLSEEEHQKLTSLKHKLEATSWRDMFMKLCDIYEEYCQIKDGATTENPALKEYVKKLVDEKLKDTKPGVEAEPQGEKPGVLNSLLHPEDKKVKIVKEGNPDMAVGGAEKPSQLLLFSVVVLSYLLRLKRRFFIRFGFGIIFL